MAARLDGAGEWQILLIWRSYGTAGIVSALVLGFFGILEFNRTAHGISQDQGVVAALSVPAGYWPRAGRNCSYCRCSCYGTCYAGTFFWGREYLEMGIAATAVKG